MSYVCLNPDLNENRCVYLPNKNYNYGKTQEECEEYCSSQKHNFLRPYIIKPKNIDNNKEILAIYKPPYMLVNIGNNAINNENKMHTILINKIIEVFENITEKFTDVKDEFKSFVTLFINLSKTILKIYNRPDHISSINLRNSEISNKLIKLYNSYFHNKIIFPTDTNNVFAIYYIIVMTLLNKLNKNVDLNKFHLQSHNDLDFLKYLYNIILGANTNTNINIDKEYEKFDFKDPNNMSKRSIVKWILNHNFLKRNPINQDVSKQYGICNRLDYDTSGIVIIGLNYVSYSNITESIANKQNIKIYTALLNGELHSKKVITNTIEKQIIKHNLGFEYNVLAKKNMNNHITIIYPYIIYKDEFDNSYTLVFIRILSGIHHQIRLHCSSIGHPLVADEIYNCINTGSDFTIINKNLLLFPRLFLHSTNYIITINDIKYDFFCNLPSDLKNSLDKLKIIKRMLPKSFKPIDNNYDMNIKKLLFYLIKYKYYDYKVKRHT